MESLSINALEHIRNIEYLLIIKRLGCGKVQTGLRVLVKVSEGQNIGAATD